MKETWAPQVRFGAFELDTRRAELRNGNGAIPLQEQPFRILMLLIGRDGELVTREEIQRNLWPDDTVVEFDQSINAAIKKLRKALGDSADEPSYIRTVAKQGYRLIPAVERLPRNGDAPSSGGAIANAGFTSGARPRWRWLVPMLLVATVLIGGIVFWRRQKAPKLTDKDTVVLADFDNQTGDPIFDDSLKQALSAQLSQSPFLNLLPNREIRKTLKEMNLSANEPLTEDLARQVCQHSGSKAVVAGSIGSFGKEYILELKAADCSSRQILAEAQERAPDKGEVLKAMDEAAISIRKQMGEPLTSVRKFAMPSAEATVPSLEAWKAYTTATKLHDEQGIAAGLPFYKRAVEMDPNFARAYNALSVAYEDMHETKLSDENGRRAYELRNTVTERERLIIEAHYYENTTGELEKAGRTYESWQQNYPKDAAAYVNFGLVEVKLGNLENALQAFREGLRLRPDSWIVYLDLASAYVKLNRLEEAEQVYELAAQRNVTSSSFLGTRYMLAFLRGDKTQLTRWSQDANGKPSTDEAVLSSEADVAGWYGRLGDARRFTEQAMNAAERNGSQESAAVYRVQAGLREAAAGNLSQARADTVAGRALGQSADIDAMAAITLALAGDVDAAETLAAKLDKDHPLSTLVQRYWLPTIRGTVALAERDPHLAIESLNEMGSLELGMVCYLAPVYVRGEAYLMLQDGQAAAAEFQKFVDHYGVVEAFPWGALARLGLARAYALEAETDPAYREKARTAYQNFLALWKDADPDIPIYKQAKAEYAKLQ